MWKLIAICLLTSAVPALSVACEPSKACALERARQLALQQLAAGRSSRADVGGSMPAAHLIAVLERHRAASESAQIIAEVVERARVLGRRDAVLTRAARELAASSPERALELAEQVEDSELRNRAHASLASEHTDFERFTAAARAIERMSPGQAQDHETLRLAEAQLRAGLATAARTTIAPMLQSTQRAAALRVQANAAALDGDYPAALALLKDIATDEERSLALYKISELQIERQETVAALLTLDVGLDFLHRTRARWLVEPLAEALAAAGAIARAEALLAELDITSSNAIETIASGQVRGEDFAGASATLLRLPKAERRDSHARWELARRLLLTDADIASTLDVLAQPSETAMHAAIELERRDQRARAGAVLDYAVQRELQSPGCLGASCPTIIVEPSRNAPCAYGSHDRVLCNLAALQAKLDLIAAAEATAAHIESIDLRLEAWMAIAQAHVVARRASDARRTLDRCSQWSKTSGIPLAGDRVITAYAAWVRANPKRRRVLPNTRRTSFLLSGASSIDSDAALTALAGAHAGAGDFTVAFEVADKLVRSDRAGAYIEIFDAAR